MRWRSVGLEAIKSVASSEALASLAGRQLDVVVPILLENLWTDNLDFIDLLEHRAQLEEKIDTEKLLRRRTSIATVRTVDDAQYENRLRQWDYDIVTGSWEFAVAVLGSIKFLCPYLLYC